LLVLAVLLLGAAALATGFIYGFLSPSNPVPAEVLVVEYWLPDYALQGAVAEFKRGHYKYVMTSGTEFPRGWGSSSLYKTGADLAAATLAAMGLETNCIVVLSPSQAVRDRTYSRAVAIAEWLEATNPMARAVNLYSLGPHARRSRLLYQKALGKKVKVGVFAHPPDSYDPNRWWSASNGFRDVTGEALAYFYARTLFHPWRWNRRTRRASVGPASSRLLAFTQLCGRPRNGYSERLSGRARSPVGFAG